MSSIRLYNLARMWTPTTGVGPVTLGSAVSSFLTFAQAGAQNGDTVSYAIDDGNQREVGRGLYSFPTLTRRVLRSTNDDDPIDLSGRAQVSITAVAEDVEGEHLYAVENTGTATAWEAFLPPLMGEPLSPGITFWFKPRFDSQISGAQLEVNDGAAHPVMYRVDSPIGIGDFRPESWLLLFFDGTQWLIKAGGARVAESLILTRAVDWYVDGTTGHDDNYDGSSATVGVGSAGPFRTIQRAIAETQRYIMSGYITQRIRVANGSYIGPVNLGPLNGAGTISLIGNPSNPAVVSVTGPAAGESAFNVTGGEYTLDGFHIASNVSAQDGIAMSGGRVMLDAITISRCGRYHISAVNAASFLIIRGPIYINAAAGTIAHMYASNGAQIGTWSSPMPGLTAGGAMSFSNAFIVAEMGARVQVRWAQAGVGGITGRRYNINSNSVLNTLGGSLPPGDQNGVITSGGQFVA